MPQSRAIGAMFQLVKQQRERLGTSKTKPACALHSVWRVLTRKRDAVVPEKGDKFAAILAEPEALEVLKRYQTGSLRDPKASQVHAGPAELVVESGASGHFWAFLGISGHFWAFWRATHPCLRGQCEVVLGEDADV